MKTPREVLFDRHRRATRSLDAIRERVLVNELRTQASDRLSAPWLNVPVTAMKLWRELILPCRRIWCALAVMWAVILALIFSSTDGRKSASRQSSASSPEVQVAVREQRLMRLELLGAPVTPGAPHGSVSPRSESGEGAKIT